MTAISAGKVRRSGLTFKFFKLVLLDDLTLDLLDGDYSMLPTAFIHDAVSALTKFAVELQFTMPNLIISRESSIIAHHLLLLNDVLSDLLLKCRLACSILL